MKFRKNKLEMNLARDIKSNKNGFSKYKDYKRKTRENVGPLLKEMVDLVTRVIEKADVLNAFTLLARQASGVLGPRDEKRLD